MDQSAKPDQLQGMGSRCAELKGFRVQGLGFRV